MAAFPDPVECFYGGSVSDVPGNCGDDPRRNGTGPLGCFPYGTGLRHPIDSGHVVAVGRGGGSDPGSGPRPEVAGLGSDHQYDVDGMVCGRLAVGGMVVVGNSVINLGSILDVDDGAGFDRSGQRSLHRPPLGCRAPGCAGAGVGGKDKHSPQPGPPPVGGGGVGCGLVVGGAGRSGDIALFGIDWADDATFHAVLG